MENNLVIKEEYSISKVKSYMGALKELVQKEFVQGVHYMTIQGHKTILLPGAQLLLRYLNMNFKYTEVKHIEIIEKGKEFVMYVYTCELFDKDNHKLGECIGSANSLERNYVKANFYDIINNVNKMAQKRAFNGAILYVTGMSVDFTCDIEDMDQKLIKPKTIEVTDYVCSDCGTMNLPDKVAKFSQDRFKKTLCMPCQNKMRNG
jgi:hypothetical protein